ncbi:MAG: hypothetical protein M3N21_08370 [Actinomycetota bacterium]|nr:hypothetical protein [Actinomycetota bacterium]
MDTSTPQAGLFDRPLVGADVDLGAEMRQSALLIGMTLGVMITVVAVAQAAVSFFG